MKTLGIVGGIAPSSTIVYYQEIIAAFRARVADDIYPRILLNSIDLRRMLNHVEQDRMDWLRDYMVESIKPLARAGADFGVFASNTPHMIFSEIESDSPIPLVSIVAETVNRASERGFKCVGLFGTGFTMQHSFFPDAFSVENIEVVVPNTGEQEHIHNKYMTEFVAGQFNEETKESFIGIAHDMRERSGIEALVLGGTELSLILSDESQVGLPILDTTRIHVAAVVEQMVR